MDKKLKEDGKKLVDVWFKFIFNILYNAAFVWATVNLFTSSFKISFYLTFKQSISIILLATMLGVVFGIGGKSK